jgi:hypothetical protein
MYGLIQPAANEEFNVYMYITLSCAVEYFNAILLISLFLKLRYYIGN